MTFSRKVEAATVICACLAALCCGGTVSEQQVPPMNDGPAASEPDSGLDGGSAADAGEPRCTPEQTAALMAHADMSRLFGAIEVQSHQVVREAVVANCCTRCAAGRRPQVSVAAACISCVASYAAGNPATHITGCSADVCP